MLFKAPYHRLAWLIITFGVLVRLFQYLVDRSLWADEASLALNIVDRSFTGLLQPLDYDQAAPIGFLLVEKLAISLFGNNEHALRLFPLLCGMTSIFLFYKLAKQYLQPTAVLIALMLFVSAEYLIYYSSEVKQYSSDVTVAILAFLTAQTVGNLSLAKRYIPVVCLLGAILIWFSHPAVFVLFGVGISSVFVNWLQKERVPVYQVLAILLSWSISFLIFYWFFLRGLTGQGDLMESWSRAFPTSVLDFNWLGNAFIRFFYRPLGLPDIARIVAIPMFLVGSIALFKRRKEDLLLLLAPYLATLFAAYLHKYPFQSRLILFLSPFVILLIASGADDFRQKSQRRWTVIPGAILLILLLAPSAIDASSLLFRPALKEEIKPVMSYIKAHQQTGDRLYVFQRGEYQFKYYASKFGYQPGDYIIGVDDLDQEDGKTLSEKEKQRYQADIDKLKGDRRVWVLFSHARNPAENEWIRTCLDQRGHKIDEFHRPGAFVYLYDLS